jgi:hypothetical protein
MTWRDEVLDPATMTEQDIRAELRHDLYVYERVRYPLSQSAMAARINALVAEMDSRFAAARIEEQG